MKIAAVVVTYNRITLLKRVIKSLKNQEYPLTDIIIVNNGSTDGTTEWLKEENGVIVINQENVGGSGGFYTGIQYAFDHQYDWIWCMDDDVYPEKACLKILMSHYKEKKTGILCPMRVQNNRPFLSEVKEINLTNPFKKIHKKKLSIKDIKLSDVNEIIGMTFEGPLIKREVVEKIGLPNKDYFILYDDTDYSYRAYLAGFKILHISNAILRKELFFNNLSKVESIRKNKWKLMYHLRNTTYFSKKYGKNAFFRVFGSLPIYTKMFFAFIKNIPFNNKYSIKDFSMLFKMYQAGKEGHLGKM